jgi:hypothetical protein
MKSAWIHSPGIDLPFLLGPPFLALLLGISLSGISEGVPPWAWIVFILCIDVAHVYSTLFRTYLDPLVRESRPLLLAFAPLLCWLAGVLLYSVSAAFFWTSLAYLAVFHFARQQYGFLMLYSRGEPPSRSRLLDQAFVYLATLYPLLWWHAHLPRRFHWFVDGDFVPGLPPLIAEIAGYLYLLVIAAYFAKEALMLLRGKSLNVPRQLVLIGTAASWYVGIVALNGDLVFTVTNVVAHGIPYIALVWIMGRKEAGREPGRGSFLGLRFSRVYSLPFLPIFLGILFLLAFLEEGLWDGLIWREHRAIFSAFGFLPGLLDRGTLAWLVPLLSLPQSTHYVLDGFIWRLKGDHQELEAIKS